MRSRGWVVTLKQGDSQHGTGHTHAIFGCSKVTVNATNAISGLEQGNVCPSLAAFQTQQEPEGDPSLGSSVTSRNTAILPLEQLSAKPAPHPHFKSSPGAPLYQERCNRLPNPTQLLLQTAGPPPACLTAPMMERSARRCSQPQALLSPAELGRNSLNLPNDKRSSRRLAGRAIAPETSQMGAGSGDCL